MNYENDIARMLEESGDNIEAVAARLKRVRDILGLNKKDFAERAGMSEQVYGPFENAKRPLSLIAAKKLRAAYGLSLEFTYFGKIDDLPTRISKEL
jgi:transcriptional regulator with XRE-family HTH domain